MDLEDEVEPLGATTAMIGTWRKDTDESWSLINGQITTVVEVGLSELGSMRSVDARGWVGREGSPVQTAISIDIKEDQPYIIFKRWERETASRRTSQPVCRQEIHVTREDSAITASEGLVLPFEKVVGRPYGTRFLRRLAEPEAYREGCLGEARLLTLPIFLPSSGMPDGVGRNHAF